MTVALLFLLFRRFDWHAFQRLLHVIPWWFYAISFATVLAQAAVLAGSTGIVLTYFILLGAIYQQFAGMATGVRPALPTVVAVVATIATLSSVAEAALDAGDSRRDRPRQEGIALTRDRHSTHRRQARHPRRGTQ